MAALATASVIGIGAAAGLTTDDPTATGADQRTGSPPAGRPDPADAPAEDASPEPAARPARPDRRDPALSRSATGSTRAESRTTNNLPDWLDDCRTEPQGSPGPNGQIPDARLCELPDGSHLRGDAAAAWARLSAAYAARFDGEPCMTGGYRDLATQYRLFAVKPGLAARPGTSNHGWGVAADLCGGIETFGAVEHQWMVENAGRYGWTNPPWARVGGSRPEPWHWEFSDGAR